MGYDELDWTDFQYVGKIVVFCKVKFETSVKTSTTRQKQENRGEVERSASISSRFNFTEISPA